MRLMAMLAAVALGWAAAGPSLARQSLDCRTGAEAWTIPAAENAWGVHGLSWAPFDQAETGWETYLPLVQREIATGCPPGTPAFAQALGAWQARWSLPATGVFDPAAFQVMRGLWQERRPFVMIRARGECPDPPPLPDLGYLVAEEEHADRLTRLLRRDVLDAYRALVAAARAEVAEVAADPELLQIFSGFRDPEADAARCAQQGNCDGLRRAVCSPHRTGTAVDLYVGAAPGRGVDSTAPDSRLWMTQGTTYRWLVENAGRFGFVPYVFEPWHWEWTGSPVP